MRPTACKNCLCCCSRSCCILGILHIKWQAEMHSWMYQFETACLMLFIKAYMVPDHSNIHTLTHAFFLTHKHMLVSKKKKNTWISDTQTKETDIKKQQTCTLILAAVHRRWLLQLKIQKPAKCDWLWFKSRWNWISRVSIFHISECASSL